MLVAPDARITTGRRPPFEPVLSSPYYWPVRTPKLANARPREWYRYYAGYTSDFVEDALAVLDLTPGDVVLDPWNGSGTTTLVAHTHGYRPIGVDANPALVLIARGRLLARDLTPSLGALAEDVIDHARNLDTTNLIENDPLETWLEPTSARFFRCLEAAVQHVLVDHDRYRPLVETSALDRITTLTAFFYVAVFDVVRAALKQFVGSNPTWVKAPEPAERLRVRQRDLEAAFRAAVQTLSADLKDGDTALFDPATSIQQGTSTNLALQSKSVHAAVTSPPYCTRIDYIMATRPELAVMGFSVEQLSELRRQMVGTPTVALQTPLELADWGPTTLSLLKRIKTHTSRASATYYRKYFTQYFDSLWRSLAELRRVVRPGGRIVLVVQDSYYKELRIDLARVVREMAERLAWTPLNQLDYPIGATKAAINPRTRPYRRTFSATESALILG